MPSIFIVDDDDAILDSLKIWFTSKKYTVTTFSSGLNLLASIVQHKPDLVLLDVSLNDEDGRQICRAIKETVPPTKVILFSANPSTLLTYEHNYADSIINKPFRLTDLESKCNKLLSFRRR